MSLAGSRNATRIIAERDLGRAIEVSVDNKNSVLPAVNEMQQQLRETLQYIASLANQLSAALEPLAAITKESVNDYKDKAKATRSTWSQPFSTK